MGQLSERKDLLRILLADDDDANAFVFQCGINRLSRPCAFQRVGAHALLPEKLLSFRPDILIAAGHFAQPREFKQIKQLTNGHPVVCVVDSPAAAEACLDLGAADCVLMSDRDQLAACLERHLHGSSTPSYQRVAARQSNAESKGQAPAPKKSAPSTLPSKLESKLDEIDRRLGAFLRRLAKQSRTNWHELIRVSRVQWARSEQLIQRRYKLLKMQWLLHKQKRLVRETAAKPSNDEVAFPRNSASRFDRDTSSPRDLGSRKIFIMPAPADSREYRDEQLPCKTPLGTAPIKVPATPSIESPDADTLRTLELSFKTLFHTGLDAMFLMDGLGCFLHTNAPGCALLGLAPAELLGKSLLEFVPMDQKAQVSAMWEALLIEGQQKAEIQLQTPAGDKRDVLLSGRSNLWFGVHLLVLRDQTELKALRNASRSFGDPTNAA